ncbi:MAG: DEAD/DEAH box helicase [Prevotella sp.]|jgi:DNA replication ATP-dependent helicase Dna2
MNIRCPKCKHKFDLPIPPRQEEIHSNCPFCGIPIIFNTKTNEVQKASQPATSVEASAGADAIGTHNITAEELFQRIEYIATAEELEPATRNKIMHETLVLACTAGLADEGLPAGNIFSKVDILCKRLRISTRETFGIQRMRFDSNRADALTHEQLLYDCRSLAVLISAIYHTGIPGSLLQHIPASPQPEEEHRHIDARCLRGVVREVKKTEIIVQAVDHQEHTFRIALDRQQYLSRLLKPDMQVNLLDLKTGDDGMTEATVVVEPDFLIDISLLARCFTSYGHHPLAYTVNRMMPVANSQAILIGNFAGNALDDIINKGDGYDWRETFKTNFRTRALEYCTCPDLNKRADFHQEAKAQVLHIQQAVKMLFGKKGENGKLNFGDRNEEKADRDKAILEPSFVCEQLGLQGRVDLMTTDLRLLVEQKSGGNWSIQTRQPGEHDGYQKEDHYVQVLLYYESLSRNFNLGYNKIDGRLLYSKYPMPDGLVPATYYKELVLQALDLRNRIVAGEFYIARHGFETVIDQLTPDILNENGDHSKLWTSYILPRLTKVTQPLHELTPLQRAYFCRMMTFVYQEQLASKLGVQEGTGNATADLWNMPLAEKRETGNIYTGLTITEKEQTGPYKGYDLITLDVPDQGEDFLPNFRLGDSIYLYPYIEGEEPDVRRSLLFKGALVEQHSDRIQVHLSDGQQNPDIFEASGQRNFNTPKTIRWCVEHSGSDGGSTAAIRSLRQFITDPSGKRDLILCQRTPQADTTRQLTRSYNPTYDDIILRAKQARDFFLIVGPPGTGKTSMALQYLVREALASSPTGTTGSNDAASTKQPDSILIMAYTNRAVDEICAMLTDNNIDYTRIGNEQTCDKRFRDHLIDKQLQQYATLTDVRAKILSTRVVVGTTSTLNNRTYLFQLKHFSVAIVDEASQILEPQLVGLLTQPDKFILIGDYKQLPAVVQQNEHESAVDEALLQDIGLNDCRSSLFERLIRNELRQGRQQFIGTLNHQGRMHPDVAAFSNSAFYVRENIQPVPLPHQQETSLGYDLPAEDDLDRMLQQHRLIFLPSKPCRQPGLSDKVNADEARTVADLLRRIRRFYGDRFDPAKTVGVIVPYRNQIAMIRKEIEKLNIPELEDIAIDTVERYQGSQRDVIIYSFTIQQRYQLDFLAANTFMENGHPIDRKLNVALTRARRQLILLGNRETLEWNPLFRQLIDFATGKDK